MIGKRKVFVTAAVCAAFGRAWAQAPQFATLDIEWENAVGYVDVVSPNPRTSMPFYGNCRHRIGERQNRPGAPGSSGAG